MLRSDPKSPTAIDAGQVRVCFRSVSAWPRTRLTAAWVAALANLPFASIDQVRLAPSLLDVSAMRRGWLRHPRRLAVGHSYSPDQFESRPETWTRGCRPRH